MRNLKKGLRHGKKEFSITMDIKTEKSKLPYNLQEICDGFTVTQDFPINDGSYSDTRISLKPPSNMFLW